MTYDFTSIIDRTGMDAIAVEEDLYPGVTIREGFSKIPMWVADMNFKTVPTIPKALIQRAEHPLYGYFSPKEEYFARIIQWQANRLGTQGLLKKHISWDNGVLGGVSSALHILCPRGGSVLIHTPAYIGFTSVLKGNGYHIVESPLKRDENGVWRMDFSDMEEKIKCNHIHTAIFCSPHNPTGRVWERAELEQAMELFQKYDVYVLSDEIWSDLTLDGYRHIPTQSISEDAKLRTVAFYAPSKTFNLAGLVGSYRIVYNPRLSALIRREASLSHYNSMNVMSMHALIGAYEPEGYVWVDELRQVLSQNVDYACRFITEHFEGVTLSRPQGTYMLLLDCEAWCKAQNKTMDALLRAGAEVGVFWQDGRPFRMPYGIRMNLALPTSLVMEAMERLNKYVF